jgi:hypothetical protein
VWEDCLFCALCVQNMQRTQCATSIEWIQIKEPIEKALNFQGLLESQVFAMKKYDSSECIEIKI